jgi:hypothetical protein
MNDMLPQRPAHLPEFGELCLQALVEQGLAATISLGGALGLLHYLDYRQTHDVDAWWAEDATAVEQRLVVATVAAALQPFGQVKTRTWGDVVSIELDQGSRKTFSFQIARRTVQLEPSGEAPWVAVPLDSLADLLASKMVALIERGAPRDFRDIFAGCQAGVATPATCWALWRRRQLAAGSDADRTRAELAITTHLARIAQHRPLDRIVDPDARQEATRLRTWFAEVFLPADSAQNDQLD